MSKIIYFFKQSWVMMTASLLFGLTLSMAQTKLGPLIEEQEQIRMNQLMQDLIIEAANFDMVVEDIEVLPSKGKILNTTVYQALAENGRKGELKVSACPIGGTFYD